MTTLAQQAMSYIRTVPDFPITGIQFKDLTPLFRNLPLTEQLLAEQVVQIKDKFIKINKVIGIEARGFITGPLLAHQLGAQFIPVRKPGKLPPPVLKEIYQKEYGTDTLEMAMDAIEPGDNVLIHDDILATGGTAKAVAQMVTRMGGRPYFSFLGVIKHLEGEKKLPNKDIFYNFEF